VEEPFLELKRESNPIGRKPPQQHAGKYGFRVTCPHFNWMAPIHGFGLRDSWGGSHPTQNGVSLDRTAALTLLPRGH